MHNVKDDSTLVIGVLALSGAVVSIVQSVVLPLLPAFPEVLGASPSAVAWLATSSLIAGGIATPVVGRLGDLFGKRRVTVWSLIVLIVGSMVCARASTLTPLLIGRVLQGASLGLVPLAISLLHELVDERRLGFGLALISATLGIGAGIGIPAAGVVTERFGWPAVFWMSAAAAGVALVLILITVREPPVRGVGDLDVTGALGLSGVLLALMLVVSRGHIWGWTGRTTLPVLVAALAGGWVWGRRQLRRPSPLVDLRALRVRPVLLSNVAGLLLGVGMFINVYLTTEQVLIPDAVSHGFGASLVVAGLCMLPGTIVMALLSPLSPRISQRRGPSGTLAIGSSVIAGGFVFRIAATGALWQIALGAAVVSAGIAIAYGSMPAIILANTDPSISASANSISTLARAIGASLGSAVAAAILTSMSVPIGNGTAPSLIAIRLVAAIAAAAAGVAGLVACRIARHGSYR